jgi:hypothetical protein
VPLDLYWSDSRQDNFTTATDQGRRDAVAAGYRFVRTEGYVWPTQGVVPIDPIGEWRVVPLDLYWHPGRGDNFLAMSKLMADRAKQEGYVFVRNEGFLRFPVPN